MGKSLTTEVRLASQSDPGLDACGLTIDLAEMSACADSALALIEARRTILPKRLKAPGPTVDQLHLILRAAAAAPDHGELVPWRFIIVPLTHRTLLGEAFAQALIDRDPAASAEQIAQAREKAERSPLLMLAVVREPDHGCGEVPFSERLLSAGCAIQNILLVATALGFGSALTSGKAMGSQRLHALFALKQQEHAVCFISIGSVEKAKPPRQRPRVESYVSVLGSGS
jgi:nitroreductase